MKAIYSHRKHRRRSIAALVGFTVFFGIYIIMATTGLVAGIAKKGPWESVLLIGLMLIAAGAWALFWHVRFFLRIPRDVSILGSGLIRFRMRRGEETVDRRDLEAVLFSYSGGSGGYLQVKTAAKVWFLPSNRDEAEDLIRTLASLNPNIRIKRREQSSG